jgi:hypothetical protein
MQWPHAATNPPDHQLPAVGQVNPLQAMADLINRPIGNQRLRLGSLSQHSRQGRPTRDQWLLV